MFGAYPEEVLYFLKVEKYVTFFLTHKTQRKETIMTLPTTSYEITEGGTTSRLLVMQWSNIGNSTSRKQSFGGRINSLGVNRVARDIYLIPNSVNITAIHDILMESLNPSDRAVMSYPYGNMNSGASAMFVRRYGRAVTDQD